MRVLIACEFSGRVCKAFLNKGHDAMSCDFLPTEADVPHYQGDIFDVIDDGWDMIIAHPPCTFLCVTGNKWFYHPDDKHLPAEQRRAHPRFPNRMADREKAVDFFMAIAESPIKKKCIENPVGIMSTRWRKPSQIIQPFQFGHPEPKKTCLWLEWLPDLVPTKLVEPEYFTSKSGKRLAKWYYLPSYTPERQTMRSRTFQGIADAMAAQWA